LNKVDDVAARAELAEILSGLTVEPHEAGKGSVLMPKMVHAEFLDKRKLTKI